MSLVDIETFKSIQRIARETIVSSKDAHPSISMHFDRVVDNFGAKAELIDKSGEQELCRLWMAAEKPLLSSPAEVKSLDKDITSFIKKWEIVWR